MCLPARSSATLCHLALASASALLVSTAHGQDLLRTGPQDVETVAEVALQEMEVDGAALARIVGDTLDVVLVGRPTRIRFPLIGSDRDRTDALRLHIGASEPLAATTGWARDEEVVIRHPRRVLPSETISAVDLPLPRPVTAQGPARVDAAVLEFPAVVGRVRIVGAARWIASSAPLSVLQVVDRLHTGRLLRAGNRVEWSVRLPRRAAVSLEAFAIGQRRADAGLTIAIESRSRSRSETARLTAPSHPARPHRIDASDFAGEEVRIALSGADGENGADTMLLEVRLIDLEQPVPPSVLILVIDTLRAHDPGPTIADARPNLRRFAASSAEFAQARANSSWTLPSTATLLSGWLPSRHGLGQYADEARLQPTAPLLAESLGEAGWTTAAISANPLVGPGSGLERGFATFDTAPARDPREPSAEIAVRSALQWLGARRGAPWMLYLHLFDPHDPYRAPEPWRSLHVTPQRRIHEHPSGVWAGRPDLLREALARDDRSVPVRDLDVALLAELYRGEVAYADHQVGALLDSLRSWGELDRTIVIVTSDHGEEFLEHGMLKHGHALHEELIAVPLTIRWPGVEPRRVEEAVSLVDLAPTLRARLGLPGAPTDGRDLSPVLVGAPGVLRPAPTVAQLRSRLGGAWEGEWRVVIAPPWKWVSTPQGERLFRLDRDPYEREDLHRRFETVSDRLRAHADSVARAHAPVVAPVGTDAFLLEKLRSLGYIE